MVIQLFWRTVPLMLYWKVKGWRKLYLIVFWHIWWTKIWTHIAALLCKLGFTKVNIFSNMFLEQDSFGIFQLFSSTYCLTALAPEWPFSRFRTCFTTARHCFWPLQNPDHSIHSGDGRQKITVITSRLLPHVSQGSGKNSFNPPKCATPVIYLKKPSIRDPRVSSSMAPV